jgi:arylsulfatase A-like enzyme
MPAKLKGSKPSQIVLNVDIAPTILSMANVAVPTDMQGQNLLDIIEKKVRKRKDFFYEHTYQKSPKLPQVEGVVTKRYKYMKYIEHDYEELFDIKKDPHETTNLAKNRKYSRRLKKLRIRYEDLKKAVQ